MTVSHGSWRLRGAFVAAAASVIGLGVCAVPAQAHTPKFTIDCSGASVDLKAYNANSKYTNTVTITVDGKAVVSEQKFKSSFHQDIPLEKTSEESVHLVVVAGDNDKYSLDESKTSPACEGTKPTATVPSATAPSATETVTPSATSSSEAPASSPTASDTPPAAAPVSSPSASAPADDLAETGSSSSTPLIAGAAAVVILAGGGITFAARRRRSA